MSRGYIDALEHRQNTIDNILSQVKDLSIRKVDVISGEPVLMIFESDLDLLSKRLQRDDRKEQE